MDMDTRIDGQGQGQGQAAMDTATAGNVTEGKTMYVNLKQEKFHFPDGRRGVRFFIIDSQGGSHLAVLGEERDTRDGHYMYKKCDDFPDGTDLCCGNLVGVYKWVKEVMIESGCTNTNNIDFKPLRRGSTLGGAAEASHHKKQRHLKDEIERIVAQAKEAEQERLKAFEAKYMSVIRTTRTRAKSWLSDSCTEEKEQEIRGIIDYLKGSITDTKVTPMKSGRKPSAIELKKVFSMRVKTLKMLRALSNSYMPLTMLESTSAYDVIKEVEEKNPCQAIKDLCVQIRKEWKLLFQKHLIVATAPWKDYPKNYGANLLLKQKDVFKPVPAFKKPANVPNPTIETKTVNKEDKVAVASPSPRKRLRAMNAPVKQASNGRSSGGIGKGRKICYRCSQIVGSPSRICPHCKADLPLKTASKEVLK